MKNVHLEILVEDQSGSIILENILAKISASLPLDLTYRIHAYSGLGKLPKNLSKDNDPQKRALLSKLPMLLRGYGRSSGEQSAVVIVVDSDKNDCKMLKNELNEVLDSCLIPPKTAFCIAIEEIEAWLLGDRQALLEAYPQAKTSVLEGYIQDSICNTWELLADAIVKEMSKGLKKKGYPEIGIRKCEWAEKVSPNMNIQNNSSPSFQHFVNKITEFAGQSA
ncbi:hypothetical protein JT05_04465 [Desulfosporosinus sp. Tol-M]|nr:hypothetical protein JT05_04465 [Desulfosporosinus sp. Tol-M]